MGWIEAIVLGIVQGLTEFLPISSTAHLRIVPAFFGWDDPGAAFTAVTQLGTMAAVLLFFRKDLWAIAVAWVRGLTDAEQPADARLAARLVHPRRHDPDRRLRAPVRRPDRDGRPQPDPDRVHPDHPRRAALHRRPLRVPATHGRRPDLAGRHPDRAGAGLRARPGVSRSGATITAGLFLGLGRADAARYSFLLSVPAVVLSGLFQLGDIGEGDGPSASATAIATVLAFVSGYASIAFLLRFLVTNRLTVFVSYRIVLGVAVLVLVAAGTID
jgi:undecaprenyl-diphosphatase